MAVEVTEIEDVLHELERVGTGYIRFLTVPRFRSVNAISDVLLPGPAYDPAPNTHDIFAGRLLSLGWLSSGDERWATSLDLRFQIRGVHEWPSDPVVALWQHVDTKVVGGVLLIKAIELEHHAYDNRGDNSCTTSRIAVPTFRLLQGAP